MTANKRINYVLSQIFNISTNVGYRGNPGIRIKRENFGSKKSIIIL